MHQSVKASTWVAVPPASGYLYGMYWLWLNQTGIKKPYRLDKAYYYNSTSIFLNSESLKNKSIAVLYFTVAAIIRCLRL